MDQILPSVVSFGIGITPPDKTRSRIWMQAHAQILASNAQYEYESEVSLVAQLIGGQRWGEMIPQEWKDIYGAMYAESRSFPVDDRERVNIDKDVHRTFGVFTRNRLLQIQFRLNEKEYSESLKSVLIAATHERRYCQGFNFLAALFILSESGDKESFTLLCFLLRQRHLEVLFNPTYSCLMEYMKVFEKRLRRHNRGVYSRFKAIGFEPVCYAIEWFTTCFIVSSPSSGELSSCVIDMLLLGMQDAMLRVGLAVIDCLEPQILPLDLEDLQLKFKALTRQVDVVNVLARALTMDCGNVRRAGVFRTRREQRQQVLARTAAAAVAATSVPAATSLVELRTCDGNTRDSSPTLSSPSSFSPAGSPTESPASSSLAGAESEQTSRTESGLTRESLSQSQSQSQLDQLSPPQTQTQTLRLPVPVPLRPPEDILLAMARNIDMMAPSSRGEFVGTFLATYRDQAEAGDASSGGSEGVGTPRTAGVPWGAGLSESEAEAMGISPWHWESFSDDASTDAGSEFHDPWGHDTAVEDLWGSVIEGAVAVATLGIVRPSYSSRS